MPLTPSDNSTPAPRVAIRARVRLDVNNDTVNGWVRDISASGMFVAGAALPSGARCDVLLTIRIDGDLHRLKLEGTVARVDAEGVGVHFTTVDDTERTLLDRLVTLGA